MAPGIYHLVKIFTFLETLVIVVPTRKVIPLEIKTFPVSKINSFMQITGYSLEVNGLKQEITTHRQFKTGQTSSNNFQQVATTGNNTQHVVQTLATCWAQQCCVLLANNVASVCTGLNIFISPFLQLKKQYAKEFLYHNQA